MAKRGSSEIIETDPRLIKRGDIVQVDAITEGEPIVVIGTSVVLHLSNGMDVRYKVGTDKVNKLPSENLEDLKAEIEAHIESPEDQPA